jgi:antibiotic biosynthesis monooxygenase
MYASVLRVKIKADKVDEAVGLYERSQPSHTQQQAGCKGFLLLLDRHSGEGFSIGLWESQEAADKFDTQTLHREYGPLHMDATVHDVVATGFPAGDHTGALPAYESVIARFHGVLAEDPHQSTYEVGATAGHLDVLQSTTA